MLLLKYRAAQQTTAAKDSGYSLVEVMVTLALVSILSIVLFTGVNTTYSQYLYLQKSGTQFAEMASSSQRIANVLRGTTDMVSVGSNDLTVYAYFYPNDAYVSKVRYYLNAQNNVLLADVIPMTGNPPGGTPITANQKTYTIMSKYYKATGVDLFTFLDAAGNALALPVSDQHIIKGITIKLVAPGADGTATTNKTMTLTVGLRNRKTNL